ncbi:hypothetical protein BLNAU_14051 [Blattamonas nauphoetae]|uniref:C2H2-type domain-containing protein n=1 Tax=Blattamonas nauphoetae TaxID=2049346 RepID=A0ABQ9XI25_9EUKA|nr:hypothetical protein BLNAU_14051 [Blattamonas nauphoetae]
MHLFGQVLQNISRRGTLSQERENFLELLTQRDGQAAALIPNRDILREPFFRTLYSTVLGMPLEEYRQIILIEEQTLIYCPRASFDLTQQEMSALLAPLPNIAQTHRLLHLQLTREPIPRVPNRFTGRGRRQPQFAMACPICHIVLTEDLARHHLQMHRYVDNERLGHLVSKCPFCNVQKMPNAQLVNHWLYQCKFKHPNAKHTKCPFCRFENTGSNVMEHINTEHRDLIPHFREITTQNRPPMRRKPAKIRMCLDCYALVSDIDWKDHVKHKHIEQITNCYPDLEETVQCPLCDQRPNKLDVITHLLTDCPRNHFRTTVHRKCPFCNVSCSPNVIWAHIRVRHKALFDWSWEFVKADLSCPQCRKSRTPDKLVKHVIHHHKKNTVRSNTHDSHLCPQCLDIVPKELYFDHLVVHRRERRRYRHT